MMHFKFILQHVGVVASVLLIGLLASAPLSPTAQAGFESCQADPIVYLSDGSTVTLVVDIGISATNLKTIKYVVHTPHGVKLRQVVYTPLADFSGKEQLALYDDAPDGQVLTVTNVASRVSPVSVTATSYRDVQVMATSGYDRQDLVVTLSY